MIFIENSFLIEPELASKTFKTNIGINTQVIDYKAYLNTILKLEGLSKLHIKDILVVYNNELYEIDKEVAEEAKKSGLCNQNLIELKFFKKYVDKQE